MLQVTSCDSFHNRFSWGYSQNKGSGDSLFSCLFVFCCETERQTVPLEI